ncbi:hypothetical protein JOE23_002962 [Amphibacillus cookii]|nr:hypothetical protein [Amphibacillus cookii]
MNKPKPHPRKAEHISPANLRRKVYNQSKIYIQSQRLYLILGLPLCYLG